MNNTKKLLLFQIISTIFILILGTILHFTYNWSENNVFVGLFSAINESTWEHLKLIFFPMLITLIVGYFIFKDIFSNYICSKILGILIAISFTVIFFYTYTGIIGTNYAFLNILSFIIAVILGEYVTYKLTLNRFTCNRYFYTIILILVTFTFLIFTFNPPKINLFKDPIYNSYGIQKSFSVILKALFAIYVFYTLLLFVLW